MSFAERIRMLKLAKNNKVRFDKKGDFTIKDWLNMTQKEEQKYFKK